MGNKHTWKISLLCWTHSKGKIKERRISVFMLNVLCLMLNTFLPLKCPFLCKQLCFSVIFILDNDAINFWMSFLLSLDSKLLGATFSHLPDENINLNNDRKLIFIISAEWKTDGGEIPAALQISECDNICVFLPPSLCYACLLSLGHCWYTKDMCKQYPLFPTLKRTHEMFLSICLTN